MPDPSRDPEVDALLDQLRHGEADPAALYRRLYDELRGLAQMQRARWHGNWTMNTTALVHEAYEKLVGKRDFESRAHVLATASRAMRQVLVNYAESRRSLKRGGGTPDLPLQEAVAVPLGDHQVDDVLALDDALARLAQANERAARVVECRYFGGLSVGETAEALGVSEATVARDWRLARAWLHGELREDDT
ncbi:MAG: ECF-type sigma factor [Bacteroidota bacterium]